MEDWPKICPLLKATKDREDTQKCFKKECAWWDRHYNCCSVLSSAILLETLVKRKSRYWPKVGNKDVEIKQNSAVGSEKT